MKNFTVRKLNPEERNVSPNNPASPVVIEPISSDYSDIESLQRLLKDNSGFIMDSLHHEGAVLLRNFQINSDKDFENATTSIQGLHPMGDYFMAERGRTLVDGTNYVYYSNKTFKTGGTLRFGGFHTENYYNPDVPMYISLYCKQAGFLGGETGLVDMVNVYKELSPEFKAKLESKTFSAGLKLVSEVVARYKVSESQVIAFCDENGLKLTPVPDSKDLMINYYKPSIFEHPYSKEPALIANLGCSGMENGLLELFKEDYKGWLWMLHRIAWRYPILVDLGDIFSTDLELIKEEIRFRLSKLKIFAKRKEELTKGKPIIPPDRIESVLADEDAVHLVKSIRKNYNSFKWKTTDILLLDNFRVAHAGMPGLGSRTLRIILANPVAMHLSPFGPGRQSINLSNDYTSLADRIHSLSSAKKEVADFHI